MFKLSRYIAKTELDNDFVLVYSTRTSQLLRIKSSTFNLVENNNLDEISNDTLLELFEHEILVPKDEDEFETVINSFEKAAKVTSDVFSYTIQPSANCQLGCEYCGQSHEKLNLTTADSEKIFNYLKDQLSKYSYKAINITWYGAEPLLGISGIRYLSKKLIDLAEEIGIEYSASIITNGLAMKEVIFEELVSFKITHYQITLDGNEKSHDNSRFMKKENGKTYQHILKNIINAVNNATYSKNKCNILIRCNVHKNNYLEINDLIDEIYQLGIHDKISMDFQPVHDWGKNNADEEIGLSNTAYGEIEIDYLIRLRELGFKRNIALLPERKYTTCMITNKDSEIIDAKGRISHCWEVPYTPEFDFEGSPFLIGNINDPENKKNREDVPLANWYQDIRDKKHNTWCQGCNFLPVCGGSCPINWYKGNPACPSFKYNIQEKLTLQYLEDIKYDFKNS